MMVIADMFGWLCEMKNKHLRILMIFLISFLIASCQAEKTYYEIPKSEIVDVAIQDEAFKTTSQNDGKAIGGNMEEK